MTCNVVFVLLSKKFMKPTQKINSSIFPTFLWPGQSGQQAQAYGYYVVDPPQQGSPGPWQPRCTRHHWHSCYPWQPHRPGPWHLCLWLKWRMGFILSVVAIKKPSNCSEAFTCICMTTHAKLYTGNKTIDLFEAHWCLSWFLAPSSM